MPQAQEVVDSYTHTRAVPGPSWCIVIFSRFQWLHFYYSWPFSPFSGSCVCIIFISFGNFQVAAFLGGASSGALDACCCTCSTASDTRHSSHRRCGRYLSDCTCRIEIKILLSNVCEKSHQ